MDAVLKWIGIIGAAWLLLSVLVAIGWHAVISDGKRTQRIVHRDGSPVNEREARALRLVSEVDAELRGR